MSELLTYRCGNLFFIFLVVLHKTPATTLTEEERERQRVSAILDKMQTRYFFCILCFVLFFDDATCRCDEPNVLTLLFSATNSIL